MDTVTVRGETVTVLGHAGGFRGLGAGVEGADVLVQYPDGERGAVRVADLDGLPAGWTPPAPDPVPAAAPGEKTCGCGHPVSRCAPENCSHAFARAALWGD